MKLLLALFVAGFTVANSQSENNIIQQTSDSVKVIEESVKHLITECNEKNHIENQATKDISKPKRGNHNPRHRGQYYKQHKGSIDLEVLSEQRESEEKEGENNKKKMERGEREERGERGERRSRREKKHRREASESRERGQLNVEIDEEESLTKEVKFDGKSKRQHQHFENMEVIKEPYPKTDQVSQNKHENYNQHKNRIGEKELREREEKWRKHREEIKEKISKKEKEAGFEKEHEHHGKGKKIESANNEEVPENLVKFAEEQAQSSILIRGSPVKIAI